MLVPLWIWEYCTSMEDEKAKNPRLIDEVAWQIILIKYLHMQKYHKTNLRTISGTKSLLKMSKWGKCSGIGNFQSPSHVSNMTYKSCHSIIFINRTIILHLNYPKTHARVWPEPRCSTAVHGAARSCTFQTGPCRPGWTIIQIINQCPCTLVATRNTVVVMVKQVAKAIVWMKRKSLNY